MIDFPEVSGGEQLIAILVGITILTIVTAVGKSYIQAGNSKRAAALFTTVYVVATVTLSPRLLSRDPIIIAGYIAIAIASLSLIFAAGAMSKKAEQIDT